MTGYWELKSEEKLSAYKCLIFGTKDDLGENYVEVEEIITFSIDDREYLQEWEKEQLSDLIKNGYQSGQWDSGDN